MDIGSTTSSENDLEIESPSTQKPPSQLELIKQWRASLGYLIDDLNLDKEVVLKEEQHMSVQKDIEYLEKINKLLDDNDDFQLSESGFSKYKTLHLKVFDYLSNLPKQATPQVASKFYLVNITKHFEQQELQTDWKHCLTHLVLLPIVCSVFAIIAILLVDKTQNNIVVNILLLLCFISQFSVISELFDMVKQNAASPLRFKASLAVIYLFNRLKRFFWVCLIPIVIVMKIQPYWVDDVIIISLFIFYLLVRSADQYSNSESSSDSSENEAANV